MESALHHTFGMALAGGGARGSYAAGVMRYIFTRLPNKIGYIPWPRLVSGTSVGALNGYFAACHELDEIHRMTEIWTNITIPQIYELPYKGVFSTLRQLYRATKVGSVLIPTPLQRLIEKESVRRVLRDSISTGKCKAFIVSSTHLTSGENTLFVDTGDQHFQVPVPPQGRVVYAKIYPHHLMASAAIPLIFPPQRIDDQLYVDGGVRQNAPLSPILQSGANRILVISTRTHKAQQNVDIAKPSLALIAGKTLNALTLDPVERNVQIVKKINKIIRWGEQKYGPAFAQDLDQELGIGHIKVMHVRPSEDLGKLVMKCYNPDKITAPKEIKWFMQKIYEQGQDTMESDLLSQLLFDKTYTRMAEDLGFHDAQAQLEQLIEFF